ncbi:MAG: F0F1 ATP synthase subunit gamma [Desulfatiglandales bacterium]
METIEALKRRIQSTEDLQSVVKTMKAMAAVKIRQFQKAAEALENYNETVEAALQAALRDRPGLVTNARRGPEDRIGAIVFGTDQGMCGPLNDQVAAHALRTLADFAAPAKNRTVLAVGERVAGRLEDEGQPVKERITLPGSVAGINGRVQQVLLKIEEWNASWGSGRVILFYSRQVSGSATRPLAVHLLPLDRAWLERLRSRTWPTKAVPQYTMDRDQLISALVRQYLFVSIFRAFADSLASENTSRLASMQGAEKNIGEQLAALNTHYHQKRQMAITEELLDIVSGFEALGEQEF